MHNKTVYFQFDNRVRFGFPDEFFHFMWGYLIPSLVAISRMDNLKESTFLLRSCGPMMDKLTEDTAQLLDYPIKILPEKFIKRSAYTTRQWCPRYDIAVMRTYVLDKDCADNKCVRKMRKRLRRRPALWKSFIKDSHDADLANALNDLRRVILHQIEALRFSAALAAYKDQYLILARSPQPTNFCPERGPEIIPGYGTARRSLQGIEEAQKVLKEKGFPIQIFEPGRHTLPEQIYAFSNCKGIVGIRGAEFANLIWMTPGSLVAMIRPAYMDLPGMQSQQSRLLNLDYYETMTDQGANPVLDPEYVASILEQHEQ